MNDDETDKIINEIKEIQIGAIGYSEDAQVDMYLSSFDNSAEFVHISADGVLRDFVGFKKICEDYYHSLDKQKISTLVEKHNVFDKNLVIATWVGNIVATFKNGDKMEMNNYSVTSVFKKIDGKWKIIHAHESSLPPNIIKKIS